jgi:hypothetical protein
MSADRFWDACDSCGESKQVRVYFKRKPPICAACYAQRRRDPNRVGGRREIVDALTFMSRPIEQTKDSVETPKRSDKEYRELATAPAKVDPRALVRPLSPPGRRAA